MRNDFSIKIRTKVFQRGVSLVETIIALVILSTIGVALMALNVQIQSATNSSRSKSFAESEAQKLIEQVRNQKNIGGGVSSLINGCYSDGNLSGPANGGCVCPRTGTIGGNSITGQTQFKTYVTVASVGSGKQITANVGWSEKGKNNCTKIVTVLYDY